MKTETGEDLEDTIAKECEKKAKQKAIKVSYNGLSSWKREHKGEKDIMNLNI